MAESNTFAGSLPDSDALLRMLVSQLPAILWTTDDQLRFTSSIGAGLARLNLRPHEVNGLSLYQFFQTKDAGFPPIAAHLRALQGRNASFEQPWAGNWYESHVEPLRDDAGQIVGCVGIAHDVTERHLAEERARASEARLRQVIKTDHHDGIVQQLTAALTHLQAVEGVCLLDATTAEREVGHAIRLVRQSVDDAQRLIGGLRRLILDEQGE